MDDQSIEKLLKKSKLASAYAMLPSPELRRAIAIEYGRLLGENDLSDPMLAGHLRTSILPAVAFHRCLQEYGYTQSASLMAIRAAVLKTAKPMANIFQGMGRLPFFFSIFRIMCSISTKHSFGPKGWVFEWKRNDAYAIEWDCRSCLYVDVFRRYSVPELAPIFCESDDVMYGNIPGVRWGRDQTIGGGDKVCNFCFYNEKKEGLQNETGK